MNQNSSSPDSDSRSSSGLETSSRLNAAVRWFRERAGLRNEGTLKELLARPEAAGCRDLEDLFLALTKRRLRD